MKILKNCFTSEYHLGYIFFLLFRLEDAGYAVGARVLELLCRREKVCYPFLYALYISNVKGSMN
jgi:hypothetical protein